MSEHEPTDPETPGADGATDDLDELDAKVLEDLDADPNADEVLGGTGNTVWTDDCANRN